MVKYFAVYQQFFLIMNQTKMVASFLSSIDHKDTYFIKKEFNFEKLFVFPLLDKS